ncbi:uncharacterized protein LOC133707167 isoform X2 [Rosa rugosa]|uniref:uncharacterized protein LOC133707167 isoform X2 n=1 Tax=Rosa rugosa TaxID=74645 RepID=UPI002B405F81|nr:uncharacterized protein LOC133707167 isoform X2 [Rosa rugosa]
MVKTKVSEIPKITYQSDMMDELKAAHVLMGIGAPEAAADGVPAAAAAEESRCGGGHEESRPSSKADEINIPPWTLIIPKLEDHNNLLQLHDDQVVGVRLPADLDSVSASTAAMLVPVLGGTMSLLKKKLQKEVAGYDEDEDEEEERDVGNQHEMNQEEGEQREENKHINSFHKEDVIVLSDDDDEEEKAVSHVGKSTCFLLSLVYITYGSVVLFLPLS